MGIITWIIFGALVGWLASKIMSTDKEQGAFANIAVGILGAVVGGLIAQLFGFEGISGFNLTSLIVALVGAVILLMVMRLFRQPST